MSDEEEWDEEVDMDEEEVDEDELDEEADGFEWRIEDVYDVRKRGSEVQYLTKYVGLSTLGFEDEETVKERDLDDRLTAFKRWWKRRRVGEQEKHAGELVPVVSSGASSSSSSEIKFL